ncbi:putative rRNA maturation factor [Breznakia blatticola]|uniref:Endoribonuclease YbeY n=1 Tax=Breznakia blatticola TaxID=1754012 RepID=A0A4R7ZES0_9FIRM|nr:rRNA maturation RNase YbeY [Breznakia blatticola]TDW14678.1 putative rRNA maturation factor [Breznakia blatticola]
MSVHIENQYDFTFEFEKEFDEIYKKTKEVIHKPEHYVVSVIFVDDKQIHEINQSYRNIDRPTDVISFALLDDPDFLLPEMDEIELGDIFISIDTCKRQAVEYGHSFKRELCFLFTHGLLHLFGYDHMNEEDETKMFTLQREILDEIVDK